MMKKQAISAFFIALTVSGGAIASGVQAATLPPGNPFYFVQDGVRNLRRAFVWGTVSRALLEARLVEERLGNIVDVVRAGKDEVVTLAALKAYAAELEAFRNAASGSGDDRVLNAALLIFISGNRLFGELHDSALASSSGAISDEIARIKKASATAVTGIFESAGSGAFRARIDAVMERDAGPYRDLSALEALSALELSADSGDMINEIRLAKDDYAFSFAAKEKNGMAPLEKILEPEGSLAMRVYALEEIRARVGDAGTKAAFAAAESRVVGEMVSRRLITSVFARDAITSAHAADSLLGTGADEGAYFLEQANAFFSNTVYDLAFQHAVFARIAAVEAFTKRTVSREALRGEIGALKRRYDALPVPQPAFVERRIASIADMVLRAVPSDSFLAIREMKLVLALLHSKNPSQ